MYGELIVFNSIRLIGVNQQKRQRQRQIVTPKDIYLFFKLFENNGKTIIAEAKFQLKVLTVIFLIKNT
jgi:hypothetical protein